ncbi:MAG: TetR/AcrR family transcriptional regulator [Actinomycetota bacterium]|nr:TetR/AcrR family transcriptional regulator [Actinomycetota bacterium]
MSGSAPTRRRLSQEDRRRELLEFGLRAFTTRPYNEVKVADIAAEAGASEGLVFRYFGDKRNFYRESIRAGLALATEASDPDPVGTATERFHEGLDRYVALLENFPYAIPHVMQGGPAADPEIQAEAEQAHRQVAARIVTRMKVPDPPARLEGAVRLWLTFVQVSSAEWIREPQVDREELLLNQIAVFRGMMADVLGVPPEPTPEGGTPPLLP